MNHHLVAEISFLYVGTADFESDFRFYRDVLDAQLVWGFERFGTKVAAFRLGKGPLILIADHLNAPGVMPILAVEDLSQAVDWLTAKGWQADRGPMEIPNGTCYVFHDPSGNRYGVFENIRPLTMEKAYQDPTNIHRLF